MKKIKELEKKYGKYVYKYYKLIIFIVLIASLISWFFGREVVKAIDFILFIFCCLGAWGLYTLHDIENELNFVKERMRSHERMMKGETPMMDWGEIVIRSTMLLVAFILIIFIIVEIYKILMIKIGGLL